MERLVISWDYVDYECSGTIVECIEYESAEAFYCHLEERVNQYLKDKEETDKKYGDWRKAIEVELKKHKGHIPPDIETALQAARPNPAADAEWHIGNVTFELYNFVSKFPLYTTVEKMKGWKPAFDPPEIRTLEEWWAYKIRE